ncbi:MAG: VWA domain-containing protein [Myxococcaceae bacterium]|nr:VWA domain-containing protein [Myxococcaceae bacterium]
MSRASLALLALVACQKLSSPLPPEPNGLALLNEDVPQTPVFASASTRAAPAQGQTVVPARPTLKSQEVQAAPTLSAREVNFALQHTQVNAKVSGNIARVEVMQLYKNPSSDRLEAVYAFPLPANAAVTDMYFRIGKRVVYSEVQKREEAKKTYEAAKSEGRTAALTEQERPNLFTQSVANIAPGETVAVVIRYVHEVPLDDGRYQFVFPTTVGPRYVPGHGVKDAERVTPPTVPAGVQSTHDVDINVQLVPGVAFADVAAKHHDVVTGMTSEGVRLVALGEGDRRPNKDFVLTWAPAGAQPSAHALTQNDRGEQYVMLMLQPPAEVEAKTVRPKEMVFLVDVSGSMGGQPLDTAKGLVGAALDRMGPEDTFQLIAFASDTEQMSDKPLLNTRENVEAAKRWLGRMSGGGGTEMMKGIYSALAPAADPKRLRMVVFCTDGYIGNEQEILQATRTYRDRARVFGFGIGSSVNRYLIEGMGREGRGASDVVGPNEKVEPAVERLYKRLDRPVLTDLQLDFDGIAITDRQPEALPDLMAGQPLVVVGKAVGGKSGKVRITGRYAGAPWSKEIPIELSQAKDEAPVLGTLWARRKIDSLTFAEPSVDADRQAAITELGLKFKLITAYTSFVAVERELLVDPKLPLTQLLVPNELPEGVKAEGIFGDAELEVLPSRVKPGDPELRVKAAPTARAVRVRLPFETFSRDAAFDRASGEYVLRFLVPSGFPDGSYDVGIEVQHENGVIESRTSPLRVDTTPSAVAVVGADPALMPGHPFTLKLKPALALGDVTLDANALKGAMETKEVLVHAPWGETVFAELQGPLGIYVATLHPPESVKGPVSLEIVASDAAGNVSRRGYEVPLQQQRPLGALLALVGVLIAGLAWRKRT